jgi:hypothetical protein
VNGNGGLARDGLFQAFAVGLMGGLVPGLLTSLRVRRGSLPPDHAKRRQNILIRAIVSAILAALIFGGSALGILTLWAPSSIGFAQALAFKIAFGAAVALVITPDAVRNALRT